MKTINISEFKNHSLFQPSVRETILSSIYTSNNTYQDFESPNQDSFIKLSKQYIGYNNIVENWRLVLNIDKQENDYEKFKRITNLTSLDLYILIPDSTFLSISDKYKEELYDIYYNFVLNDIFMNDSYVTLENIKYKNIELYKEVEHRALLDIYRILNKHNEENNEVISLLRSCVNDIKFGTEDKDTNIPKYAYYILAQIKYNHMQENYIKDKLKSISVNLNNLKESKNKLNIVKKFKRNKRFGTVFGSWNKEFIKQIKTIVKNESTYRSDYSIYLDKLNNLIDYLNLRLQFIENTKEFDLSNVSEIISSINSSIEKSNHDITKPVMLKRKIAQIENRL